MARVPIIPEIPQGPFVDPETGHLTPHARQILNQWFARIGRALGNLPKDLVNTPALEDLSVTEPKHGDASVSTVKIQDNAVTQGVAVLPADQTGLHTSDDWTEIVSITHTSEGGGVIILFFANWRLDNRTSGAGNDRALWLRIRRDGTTTIGQPFVVTTVEADGWGIIAYPLNFVDDGATAGDRTYSIQILITENVTGPFQGPDDLTNAQISDDLRVEDLIVRTLEIKK